MSQGQESRDFDLSAGADAYRRFHQWDWLLFVLIGGGLTLFWLYILEGAWAKTLSNLVTGWSSGDATLVVGVLLLFFAIPLLDGIFAYVWIVSGPWYPRRMVVDSAGVQFDYPGRFGPYRLSWENPRFRLVISDQRNIRGINPLYAIQVSIRRRPAVVLSPEAYGALKDAAIKRGFDVTSRRSLSILTPYTSNVTEISHSRTHSQ